MSDTYTKNSSKVVNANGEPLVPGAYELKSVKLIRGSNGLDITKFVTDMSFTEDIFSPVMVAKLRISDIADLNKKIIKDKAEYIRGHEVLEIDIQFINDKNFIGTLYEKKPIKLRLGVREYGEFELDVEGVYTGAFTITAVDNFAILSRLQQICFAVGQNNDEKRNKTTVEHIALILKKYLKLNDNEIDFNVTDSNTRCSSVIKGVIPYGTPLQSIDWLRTKSFDYGKSPFFVYGVFNDNISLINDSNAPARKIKARSWNFLIDEAKNPIYGANNTNKPYTKFYSNDTAEYTDDESRYLSEAKRILEFTATASKNELRKFLQGEYNTLVKTIDYHNCIFRDEIIFDDTDADESFVTPLEDTLRDTPNDKEYTKQYNDNKRLRQDYISTLGVDINNNDISAPALLSHRPNSLYSTDSNFQQSDAIQIKAWNSRAIRFFSSKISNEQSEVVLYGDRNLSPGRVIQLEVDQKQSSDESSETDKKSPRNTQYLIIASVHSFMDGRYVNRLKLVRLNNKYESR